MIRENVGIIFLQLVGKLIDEKLHKCSVCSLLSRLSPPLPFARSISFDQKKMGHDFLAFLSVSIVCVPLMENNLFKRG
jgi:hypothetical protein